jgi:cell division GTPase FtsZ
MQIVRTEGFTKRNEAKASLEVGLAGTGQCGGKIVNLFAGLKDPNKKNYYDVIAVNSFVGDLRPLDNISEERKYALAGVEGGCGRKPELAEASLKGADESCKKNQKKLMEMVKEYLSNKDMYIVAGGLGGGTGTGTIPTMMKLIHSMVNIPLLKQGKKPKTIGAIVTLPRKSEPLAEKKNALKAIKELEDLMHTTNEKLKDCCKFIIFVDNEKAYRDYRKLKADKDTPFDNWMDYANHQVVSIFHEINVATSFSSDKIFDPQDLKNVFEEWKGAMTFGKIKFASSDIRNSDELVEKAMATFHDGCVLANGFDLSKSRTAGVLIVKPMDDKLVTGNSLDDIDDKMSEEMPGALYRPTGYIDWANPKDTLIYTIAKVAEFPERARVSLEQEYSSVVNEIKDTMRTEKAETSFSDVDDSIFNTGSQVAATVDAFDPFGEDAGSQDKKNLELDPFDI